MQLESWEEKAKRIKLCQAIGIEEVYNDEYKDRMNKLNQEIQDIQSTYDPNIQVNIDAKKKEIEQIERRIKQRYIRDCDYVKNYNSSHFNAKDTVAILKTGGSAMMVRNNGGNVTFGDRVAAFFKYTSFKKKDDGKRHVIRTAVSNIGGIMSLPVRIVETGIGLVAAGARYTGSKIAGTYDMPTPYKVGASARKEARQEYYMNTGSTAFEAWFKSWFNLNVDDGQGNTIKLNEKLIQDRCAVIDESIEDKYIRYAQAKLIQDQEKAKRNARARKIAYRNIASSSEVYEDIYDSYKNVDKEDVARKIMQRSVLNMGGKTANSITDKSESFVKNSRKRNGNFIQSQSSEIVKGMSFDLVDELDFSKTIGDTVWTNAVSRKNILRGKTKDIDRGLKIAAVATIAGAKYFLSRPTIIEQPDPEIAQLQQDTRPTIWKQRPVYEQKNIDVQQNIQEPITYDNATVSDCIRGDTAYWSADLEAHTAHAPTVFSSDDTVVQGINFRFKDVAGNNVSYSVGDEAIKQYINTHPNCTEFSNAYGSLNISADTPISKLADLLPEDIKQKWIEALEASDDKLSFFNESTQQAMGRGTSMAKGWTDANIPAGATKTVTKTIQKQVTVPSGYEWYEVEVAGPQNVHIDGDTISGIQNMVIPRGSKAYKIGNDIAIIGAESIVAQIIQQGLFPTFKRNHKLTRNHHRQTFNDGKLKSTDDDVYDMYIDDRKYDTYNKYEQDR